MKCLHVFLFGDCIIEVLCAFYVSAYLSLTWENCFTTILVMVWSLLFTWYSFSSSMLIKRLGLLIIYCISCIFLSCIFNFSCIISSMFPTLRLSHDVLSSV